MSNSNPKPGMLTSMKSMFQPHGAKPGIFRSSVAAKLVASLVVILLVIAGIQIAFSYRSTRQILQQEAEHTLEGHFSAYETKIVAEQNAAESIALSIADRVDVQELYLKGDRDELYNLLAPVFEQLKQRQVVHLYIENPDGTVFLRVHNPANFGDDITYRGTAKTALEEKRATSGIEIGPSRMGVRAVVPMYASSGRFIGLVEVGLDFDENFIASLKEITGADFTMWVSREAASVPNLKPVEGSPGAPTDEIFYYASTDPGQASADPEVYRSVFQTGVPEFVVKTENTQDPAIIYVAPLLGYNDKLFGLIQVSESYVPALESQNKALASALGVVGGLTALGIFLIWLLTSTFVLRPLGALAQFAKSQAAGETNARVSLPTGDEFEQLAGTFNTLAETVKMERENLEQTVSDRTKALQTSAEVTRRLTAAATPRQLAVDVVEQVQAAFHYYHAHIYFTDEATGDLVMAGGTGEAGAALLASGHKVPKGRGLVGRAAETNAPVLVPDVSAEPGWLPNPLLPETRCEISIPISLGKQVLGVLDVQQNEVDSLGEDDVELLGSIAGQVAISLQNTRTYEDARARAELESKANLIAQKIQRATSIEETLQTAIRELGMAVGAPRVRASIGTKPGNHREN